MEMKLLAGWAQIDLTPDRPVRLCGQFAERVSQEVETPVYATSLAMEMAGESVVFCACDLVDIGPNLLEAVRQELKTLAPDFDSRKLILSATHTHTSIQYLEENIDGGNSLGVLRKYLPEDAVYEEMMAADDTVLSDADALVHLTHCIATSVAEAWQNRAPASCSNQFGRAAVGMCRRVCYDDGSAQMWGDSNTANFTALEGGNDSGVELLYFFDASGNLTGVAANLSCPAQTVQHRTFISSDFWGKTRAILQERFGADVKLLALCAPAGDQCPVDLIRWVEPESDVHDPNIKRTNPPKRKADPSMFDIAGSWKAGRRVAHEIEDNLDAAKAEPMEPDCFRHLVLNVELPVRMVTMAERDEAERRLQEYVAKAGGKAFTFDDNAKMHIYSGTLARFDYQQTHHVFPCEIHILRFGNIAFATSPFELFLDYGNWIRAQCPAEQTFLIQLANGSLGYLPTEKAEKGGHYSAYVSSGLTGHAGGDLLVRRTLSEIRALFAD